MRLRALLLTASVVIGGLSVAPLQAQAATSRPKPCSAVLVSPKQWLGGKGVNVRSNGKYQGTGTSCFNGGKARMRLRAHIASYGLGWQCAELASRLYAVKGWSKEIWVPKTVNGKRTSYGIKWLYPVVANGERQGLKAYKNGSGYKPRPGDMIIHGNGLYGHVSIVNGAGDGKLWAVEQNGSNNGWATYKYDARTGKVTRGNVPVIGYIHASANKAAAVGG